MPAANAVRLPDTVGFNEGCVMPMAVVTAWSGWYSIGLARETAYRAEERKGMLIWGGASSVGSAAIQIARTMGFRVYATASERHHGYLRGLGASRVFDYRGEDVVERIVQAAKADGVTIQEGLDAAAQLKPCLEILKQCKGAGIAKLASARPVPEDAPEVEGVEAKFIMAPSGDEGRTEHFHFVFGVWLKEKLETGEFVPSPKIRVVGGGLESVNKGLDELRGGVSGVKFVVEV